MALRAKITGLYRPRLRMGGLSAGGAWMILALEQLVAARERS